MSYMKKIKVKFLLTLLVAVVLAVFSATSGLNLLSASADVGASGEAADPVLSGLLNTTEHISYMSGYADGSFEPDSEITRAEAAMVFYRLLNDQNVPITETFADVKSGDWYAEAVNTLASLDIVGGDEKGAFRPKDSITRAEFIALVMHFGNVFCGCENIFTDVDEDAWYYDYVMSAVDLDWVSGYADGTFHPNEYITRAEVANITNRVLDRQPDIDYLEENAESINEFDDVEPDYWACYDILEACISHDHTEVNGTEVWK
jgi:hypothetical protein